MSLGRREFLALSASPMGLAQEEKFSIQRMEGGLLYAEGPVWAKEGFLLFSDVARDEIRKITPGSGKRSEVFRPSANGPAGNAYDSQGRLYTCETRTRRVVRQDRKGNLEVLAERFDGKRFNAPNDIVVRKDGHVYFTDPAFGKQADVCELEFHGVFHLPPKGSLEVIAKPKGRPNGVALSADGKTLWVTNSDERNVRAYDLDKEGRATNERVVISGIDGPPKGLRLDESGSLYMTCNGLAVYSPTFQRVTQFEFSEPPSNCVFGDPDLRTLYITARTSLYRIRLEAKGAVQH
ncbi:MAG: SMP-30/gluconolactonase/LRE family protein [Bryobacteraceae bacterium]